MGVAHQGGRVPGQRRVALYITTAVPPPVARIESTMMARQVRPTSPEPECVTGLQGRESDEEGDVRNPSGPGSARSHQEAGYMAAIDLPFLRSIHPLQTRGGPYMTHHGSDCAPCGAELARHQVVMREANAPMSPTVIDDDQGRPRCGVGVRQNACERRPARRLAGLPEFATEYAARKQTATKETRCSKPVSPCALAYPLGAFSC